MLKLELDIDKILKKAQKNPFNELEMHDSILNDKVLEFFVSEPTTDGRYRVISQKNLNIAQFIKNYGKQFILDKTGRIVTMTMDEYRDMYAEKNKCRFCGKTIGDFDKRIDKDEMCYRCFNLVEESRYFYCNYCKEYHWKTNTKEMKADGGLSICERVPSNDVHCHTCGKKLLRAYTVIAPEDHHYDYSEQPTQYEIHNGLRQTYCDTCYRNMRDYHIKPYHESVELVYYDKNKTTGKNIKIPRELFSGYGVELEIGKAGQNHKNSTEIIKLFNKEIYTMYDGSIYRNNRGIRDCYFNGGFEIITHPHTEDALYNMGWKNAFKRLIQMGYRSHETGTCGLHLHISRSLFENDKAIMKMCYFYDKFISDIFKISRRNDIANLKRWASPLAGDIIGYYNGSIKLNVEDGWKEYFNELAPAFARMNGAGDRDWKYKAVNFQNRNTVEVRTMRGTLNYKTFMATLDFMITVAKNANTIEDYNMDNYKAWIKGVKPATMEYLNSRGAFNGRDIVFYSDSDYYDDDNDDDDMRFPY